MPPKAKAKQDYYDVLGVAPTATSDEIRVAYKRLAIRWHPDKNIDNKEEAERTFKEIVNAYGVLSNEQERRWYDNHKDSVLSGEEPSKDKQGPAEETKLYPYFRDDCFSGYGSGTSDGYFFRGKKGFYQVYAEVFRNIASEEGEASAELWPPFGDATLSGDEILRFYEAWADFQTKRDFAWVDIYKAHDARDRDERRAMERENKQLRLAAQAAYVTTVRMLARHAMQKDPRVGLAHLEKRQKREEYLAAVEEKRKQKLREAAEELERMRLDRTPEEIAEEERRAVEHERLYNRLMGTEEDPKAGEEEAEEEEEEEFSCLPCGKSFKSQKQLVAHEKSAKHKATLKALGMEPSEDAAAAEEEEDGPKGKKTAKQRQLAKKQRKAEELADQEAHESTESIITDPLLQVGGPGEATAAAPSPPPANNNHKTTQEEIEEAVAALKAAEERAMEDPRMERCVQCGARYPSRNQLFTHLKESGHTANPVRVEKEQKKQKKKGK